MRTHDIAAIRRYGYHFRHVLRASRERPARREARYLPQSAAKRGAPAMRTAAAYAVVAAYA